MDTIFSYYLIKMALLWYLQTNYLSAVRLLQRYLSLFGQRDRSLVSILVFYRWALVETLFHYLWKELSTQSSTLHRDSTSPWHCIRSTPKTSSQVYSIVASWRKDRWMQSPSYLSSDRPTPFERPEVNREPKVSSWWATEGSLWTRLAD